MCKVYRQRLAQKLTNRQGTFSNSPDCRGNPFHFFFKNEKIVPESGNCLPENGGTFAPKK